MNVNRFVARNTKEALAKVRHSLGADAVVLSTRELEGEVEILAMADTEMRRMARQARKHEPGAAMRAPAHGSQTAPAPHDASAGRARPAGREPARREPTPEMSTLSFQQYVRERQQRAARPAAEPELPVVDDARQRPSAARRVEPELNLDDQPLALQPAPAAAARRAEQAATARRAEPSRAAALALAAGVARDAVAAQPPAERRQARIQLEEDPRNRAELMAELRSMRRWIEATFSDMPWSDGVRRSPIQATLIRQMQANGFSERFARDAVRELPSDYGRDEAVRWLHLAMTARLQCESSMAHPLDQGGVFALLGPTGVGKTTTTAKIAARFAMRHGAQSVCLITVDTYRLAAHDQLRAYGRILGVPVHVAHDAATLADFLHLFMNKKLVLIDTMGVSQRDERVGELMASMASPRIGKLLVVSAASQALVIEDTIRAYRAEQSAGVIVSKTDEAVRLGAVTECLLRHRLRLVGLATGQRVPEDWEYPDAAALVDRALAAPDDDEGSTHATTARAGSAADRERGDGTAQRGPERAHA